jgi:hypothetical protein
VISERLVRPYRPSAQPARALVIAGFVALAACDKSGPLADLNGSPASSASTQAPPSAPASPPPDAAPTPPARVMPPRPVPTSSPTVRVTMPIETQLEAIQYMAAMQAPQPSDAPVDPEYAKGIAARLAAVGQPDVISSGRLIDVAMAKGCDATVPRESLARHTGASLNSLLAHGVLVVRCRDHELECLQSTRDADDVLCVHK